MKQYIEMVGKTGVLQVEKGFEVNVTIEDVRLSYGRVDYQVRPVSGYGLKWVSSERVKDI